MVTLGNQHAKPNIYDRECFNAILDNITFDVVNNHSIKDYLLVQNIRHYFSYESDQSIRIDGVYINPFQLSFVASDHLSVKPPCEPKESTKNRPPSKIVFTTPLRLTSEISNLVF